MASITPRIWGKSDGPGVPSGIFGKVCACAKAARPSMIPAPPSKTSHSFMLNRLVRRKSPAMLGPARRGGKTLLAGANGARARSRRTQRHPELGNRLQVRLLGEAELLHDLAHRGILVRQEGPERLGVSPDHAVTLGRHEVLKLLAVVDLLDGVLVERDHFWLCALGQGEAAPRTRDPVDRILLQRRNVLEDGVALVGHDCQGLHLLGLEEGSC